MSEAMGGISKDSLRKAVAVSKEKTRDIIIDGNKVATVRGITLKERNECRESAVRDDNPADINIAKFQAIMIIKACVEPKLDLTDLDWMLEEVQTGFIDKALSVIYQLSGMSDDLISVKKKD